MAMFLPVRYGSKDRTRLITAPAPWDTAVVISALSNNGAKLLVIYVRPLSNEKTMAAIVSRANKLAAMFATSHDVQIEMLSGHGIFAFGAKKRRSKKGYAALIFDASDAKRANPANTIPLSSFAGGMEPESRGVKVQMQNGTATLYEAEPVAKLAGIGYRLTDELISRLDHSQRDWVLSYPPNTAKLYATDAWGETLKGDLSDAEVAGLVDLAPRKSTKATAEKEVKGD
jgi:hypothetical protein